MENKIYKGLTWGTKAIPNDFITDPQIKQGIKTKENTIMEGLKRWLSGQSVYWASMRNQAWRSSTYGRTYNRNDGEVEILMANWPFSRSFEKRCLENKHYFLKENEYRRWHPTSVSAFTCAHTMHTNTHTGEHVHMYTTHIYICAHVQIHTQRQTYSLNK